jgi:hypothetical protein
MIFKSMIAELYSNLYVHSQIYGTPNYLTHREFSDFSDNNKSPLAPSHLIDMEALSQINGSSEIELDKLQRSTV